MRRETRSGRRIRISEKSSGSALSRSATIAPSPHGITHVRKHVRRHHVQVFGSETVHKGLRLMQQGDHFGKLLVEDLKRALGITCTSRRPGRHGARRHRLIDCLFPEGTIRQRWCSRRSVSYRSTRRCCFEWPNAGPARRCFGALTGCSIRCHFHRDCTIAWEPSTRCRIERF